MPVPAPSLARSGPASGRVPPAPAARQAEATRRLGLGQACQALDLALRADPSPSLHAALEHLLSQCPDAHEAHIAHGHMLVAAGQSRAARPALTRALRRHPLDAVGWATFATALAAEGQARPARAALLRAATYDPIHAEELCDAATLEAAEPFNRGVLRLRQNQPDEAVAELEQLLRQQPQRNDMRLFYIESLRRSGQTERARAELALFRPQKRRLLPALWLHLALEEIDLLDSLFDIQRQSDPDGRLARFFFGPGTLPWAQPSAPELPWHELLAPLAPFLALLHDHRMQPAPTPAHASAKRADVGLATSAAPAADPNLRALLDTANSLLAQVGTGGSMTRPASAAAAAPARAVATATTSSIHVAVVHSEPIRRQFGESAAYAVEQRLALLAEALRGRGINLHIADLDQPETLATCDELQGIRAEPGAAGLAGFVRRVGSAQNQISQPLDTLLLVGGDAIVPFARMPNSVPDGDNEILSDTPYACDSPAHVVPSRVVARLPDGNDAEFLLALLDRMIDHHRNGSGNASWWQRIAPMRKSVRTSHVGAAYVAEAWLSAARAVMSGSMAEETPLLSCPPTMAENLGQRLPSAALMYLNLHGAEGSPNWYGQARGHAGGATPNLPIAWTPQQVAKLNWKGSFLLSECCYGMEIVGRGVAESIPLTALAGGAQVCIGSTVNAYGSEEPPLVAADLLAQFALQSLTGDQPAGQAWLHARAQFAATMERQQGYLDDLDIKTLLSFVFYGDPWATFTGGNGGTQAATRPVSKASAKRVQQVTLVEGDVAPATLARARTRLASLFPRLNLSSLVVRGSAGGPGGGKAPGSDALTFSAQEVQYTEDGYPVAQAAHLTMRGDDVVKVATTR
ncbi:MAG: hypothetical protein MUD01_01590 [Chloroflexaceae bacterium]|nr:hypothetical protein [Chloroflexaceae bacterium]